MSINNSTTLYQSSRHKNNLRLLQESLIKNNSLRFFNSDDEISKLLFLFQYLDFFWNSGDLTLYWALKYDSVFLQQVLTALNNSGYLGSFSGLLKDLLSLNTFDVYKNSTNFNQVEFFNKKIISILLMEFLSTKLTFGHLGEVKNMVPQFVDLTQIDQLGPRLLNMSPPAWSSFQDPAQNIEFDVVDSEGSSVVQSSIFIYINEILVLSGGYPYTNVLGTSYITKFNDSTYHFRLAQFNPFDFVIDNPITISATAIDDEIPFNSGGGYYQYNVWNYQDLHATIVGGPDIDAPYLTNVNPARFAENVQVDTNISFDLIDDHTGINISTVNISIGDIPLIVSGVSVHNTNYEVFASLVNKGIHYDINPLDNFYYGEVVSVNVQSYDNFNEPNYLSDTFSFQTQLNDFLVISGLSIKQDDIYLPLYNLTTYDATDPTEFLVHFINTSGHAFDLTNTYIKLNGVNLPVDITTISDSHLEVKFSLASDYIKDSHLTFHVQQIDLYGSVFKEEDVLLKWGYEFCYNPDDSFPYDSEIHSVFKVYDRGEYPYLGSQSWKFSVASFPGQNLGAQIVPVYTFYDLGSVLIANNTFFEYGKHFDMSITASDYSGNVVVYNWSFDIEDL